MNKKWTLIITVLAIVVGEIILRVIFSLNLFALIGIFFKWFFGLLTIEFTLPFWKLVFVAILPILIIAGIIYIVVRKEENDAPSSKDYISDKIFEILWHWKWYHNSIDSSSLLPLCPQCKRQLNEVLRHGYRIHFGMECPNCNFKTRSIEGSYYKFSNAVIQEIEGRIRSGEHKDKLKKQGDK